MVTVGHNTSSHWDETQWEYKIVRARNREFGQREHLETLLREESIAGWVMTDKYNDSQVRFIRHRSARANDPYLPPAIDPYRTIYVPPTRAHDQNLHALVLLFVVLSVLMALVLLVLLVSLVGQPAIIQL